VIGVVESHTEPGPRRDGLLQRFARVELLGRLHGRRFLEHPPEHRDVLFAEIRAVIDDHIPPSVDQLLAPVQRTQMSLVRAGRLDLVMKLAQAELEVTARADLQRLETTRKRTLLLVVEAGLDTGSGPLAFERSGDRLLLRLPDEVAAAVPEHARAVPEAPAHGARIVLRRRDDSTEFVPPASVEPLVLNDPDGASQIRARVSAEIDPLTIAGGEPLWPGKWDVIVPVSLLGYIRECRVRDPALDGRAIKRAAVLDTGPLEVVAYWAEGSGHLTIQARASPGGGVAGRLGRRLRRLAGPLYRAILRTLSPAR